MILTSTKNHGNLQPTADQPEFEEISLVKVYLDPDDVLFAYWIAKNSTNSLSSIIFRYWRYRAEKSQSFDTQDLVVWTDLTYMGDGESVGHVRDHWQTIKEYLIPAHATGTLGNETVYSGEERFKGPREIRASPTPESPHQPLVFKVSLERRKTDIPRKQKREPKSLSRVRHFRSGD